MPICLDEDEEASLGFKVQNSKFFQQLFLCAAVWSSCVNCEFSPRALWTDFSPHSLNRHNRILQTPRFSEEKEKKKVNWKTHSKTDISVPSLHILDWPKGTNQLMFLLAWKNISSQKYKNPQNIQKGKQKRLRILDLHWDNVSENQVCVSALLYTSVTTPHPYNPTTDIFIYATPTKHRYLFNLTVCLKCTSTSNKEIMSSNMFLALIKKEEKIMWKCVLWLKPLYVFFFALSWKMWNAVKAFACSCVLDHRQYHPKNFSRKIHSFQSILLWI